MLLEIGYVVPLPVLRGPVGALCSVCVWSSEVLALYA